MVHASFKYYAFQWVDYPSWDYYTAAFFCVQVKKKLKIDKNFLEK